ncbi:subclass B3 metallo-beta-lactamase [Pseudomarimonas arenosa]|uniref:Subclass B3 metallo-beta-lactamase n=1 Tax=Pseudomarimonas arenosa TaxID=2774145 RepID=A0AAW3ZTQ0_9GAMM|nr:subclass B3 metallo-beta-lactamase [Pseudomarimonas arenosa]MBD8527752.1 subclass B3 metallo-beta-lactamase [Pseudomarimonas arenosa]
MNMTFHRQQLAGIALALALSAPAAGTEGRGFDAHLECRACAGWNAEQAPFRLAPNAWYVGPRGLSSVLIATSDGLILIDGGLPQSAAQIATHIRQLGFEPQQIRYLLNSHPHFDHAGGLAALAEWSGATVVSSPVGLATLRAGVAPADDPQAAFGTDAAFPALPADHPTRSIADGEVLRLGDTELIAEYTPGHAPGGISWRWQACDANRQCTAIVYADSLSAVSAPDYRFSDHPAAIEAVNASVKRVAGLDCQLLVSTHPEMSQLFERHARGELIDASACRRYAEQAAQALQRRLHNERSAGT